MKQYERPFIKLVTFEQKDVVTLSTEGQNKNDTLFDANEYFSTSRDFEP